MNIYTTHYRHYRIPNNLHDTAWNTLLGLKKKQPPPEFLYPYSRDSRWLGLGAHDFTSEPSPRGGLTSCSILIMDEDKEDSLIARATGVAICSLEDNFSYYLGREIALGRAKAALESNVSLWIPDSYRFSFETLSQYLMASEEKKQYSLPY